ncbi:MAG: hypothetical protein JXB62_04565 [Pirellulales bacterium]|nr:hypothetical protein [Pirellulales bacterium]
MSHRIWLALALTVGMTTDSAGAESGAAPAAIVSPGSDSATFGEALAAKEIRRYVYLRTGTLLPMVDTEAATPDGGLIVVASLSDFEDGRLLPDAELRTKLVAEIGRLEENQHLLRTVRHKGRSVLLVTGRGPGAPLYSAYRLAERLGVRFYLHGDVVPDRRVPLTMPQIDETSQPLFELRGIQPFHDFPEGPDWWDADGYKAIVGQLPKLRMNFFGLHTYPQGGVGPEPAVWIGAPGDFQADGKVTFSYPSRHFTTANVTGAWGYQSAKTGDYRFGAADLFADDDHGAGYMRGMNPWTGMSPEQGNALFDRFGVLLGDVFGFARQLGVKTCLGTETPLTIPTPVQGRLKALGKDPSDPAVVQEVYEGMFGRIRATHPLDYYWFWTPEGWTWSGTKQEQIDATLADFRAAIAAAQKVEAPFTLATCGWVLGPPQDRALFDNVLPKEMPMSCINREVGHAPVEPGFANVGGRPKWAIPWLEDDPALIIPQLWAGRMRKDAADARQYGCTGLMGIHWRTRILGPNVSALAQAAWQRIGPDATTDEWPHPPAPRPPEGPQGGKYARFPNNSMADTDDDPLYQSVRYDVGAYHLDVPNGKYVVTLKLCEPHYDAHHKRVFGVKIQGRQVIDTLDLFRQAGKNKALDYTFRDVEVADGRLAIDFVYQLEYPCIAAIVVQGEKVTRKINCGGPAYQDYAADWPESTDGGRQRFLPCDDFYLDWATAQFGPEAAEPIAELFTRIDGRLPRPSTWVGGPGGIQPDARGWEEACKQYAFVAELAQLQPRIQGAGNRQRFGFWLSQFRYLRAVAQINCTWHRFNEAMKQVKAADTVEARQGLARELALPIRQELVAQVAEVHRHLLETAETAGLLGNVTNWQQHLLPELLTKPGEELAAALGEDLPAEAVPSKRHRGEARLFVPVVRTSLIAGEAWSLQAILLPAENRRPREIAVYRRELGTADFTKVLLQHAGRGVYTLSMPAEAVSRDFEYYVEAAFDASAGLDGAPVQEALRFPPTAPRLNQTVVVVESR